MNIGNLARILAITTLGALSCSAEPANFPVAKDGGGPVTVSGAALAVEARTVTLTLSASLEIDTAYTVTMGPLKGTAGQTLGEPATGRFRTWDNDPAGVQVFILAGQSNMVGCGKSEMGRNPNYDLLKGCHAARLYKLVDLKNP